MKIPPVGPEKIQYQKEVKEGVQIFEESFKGLQKSKLAPQKQEYEKAMDESLQAIQDAAKALANQELLKMKERLEKDYKSYLSDPNPTNGQKVEKDLSSLRKSVP